MKEKPLSIKMATNSKRSTKTNTPKKERVMKKEEQKKIAHNTSLSFGTNEVSKAQVSSTNLLLKNASTNLKRES